MTAHLILLDLTIETSLDEQYKLRNTSLLSLLHSQVGPNIGLRILFSNTLRVRSSLNVRYVSETYSTTGNTLV
jgi:hypothetical protein